MQTTRILTVSDIHSRVYLYHQLSSRVRSLNPDVIVVASDWLDAEPLPDDKVFSIPAAALFFSQFTQPVVFVPGNHEINEGILEFEKCLLERGKKFNFLATGCAATLGPCTIVGFPPSDLEIHPETWLPKLYIKHGEKMGSLWISHNPPIESPWACPLIEEAVKKWQPKLLVSGMDHCNPIRTGKWKTQIGETVCINTGQILVPEPGVLRCCLIEMDFLSNEPSLPVAFRVTLYD